VQRLTINELYATITNQSMMLFKKFHNYQSK